MQNKILFVFEGEKTENQIINNLSKYFYDLSSKLVVFSYCGEIYQLFKQLSQDTDLEPFVLLKERNKKKLADFQRNDFSEIYLFFDYDGHSSLANDEDLLEMLKLFDNETEFGKLLISYPMVEALKHVSNSNEFKDLKVNAKNNISYKNLVSIECDTKYMNFKSYQREIWIQLTEYHLKKLNFIVNDVYEFPSNNISQIEIFENQLEKYIEIDCTVAVLSAFPVFIFDYFGVDYTSSLIETYQT